LSQVSVLNWEYKGVIELYNFHFDPNNQAVANSLQLKAALGEVDIKMPDTMFARFPELNEIAQS